MTLSLLQITGVLPAHLEGFEDLYKLRSLPTNETYHSELGIDYIEPQISHQELLKWFSPFINEGEYGGITTSLKIHTLANIEFGTMLTYVFLKKKTDQQQFEITQYQKGLAQLQKSVTTFHKILSCFQVINLCKKISLARTSLLISWLKIFFFKFFKCPYQKTEKKLSITVVKSSYETQQHQKFLQRIEKQKKCLATIKETLSSKIQEWKIDRFEVGSSSELLSDQFNLDINQAVKGDYILLFHKKV